MTKKETKQSFGDHINNALDGVIGVFSPATAYRRTSYRMGRKIVAESYRGASRSRLRTDWYPQGYSADRDAVYDLSLLRERSRDLNRNDAFASGITNTMVINDIGIGIRPQSIPDKKALGLTDSEMEDFQYVAEAIWEEWIKCADASDRMDFYEMQSLIDRQILENGEAILIPLMIRKPHRPYLTAIGIVEADRLSSPSGLSADKSVRMGVKIGEMGEPIEYYIRKTHPGDLYASTRSADDYLTYPAYNSMGRKNVYHLYEVKRPGQSRGIPFFAPVLTYFKDLSDYSEAELVAARIAACFAIFIKKTDTTNAYLNRTTELNSTQRIETMEPGIIEHLAEGESIETANPNRPNAQFEPFINHILKAICASLNLSYEIVSKDFSKSTYSSARAGLLQAYRYFRMRQSWHVRKYCQSIWELVLEEAFLKGELPVRDFYNSSGTINKAWCRARWIAPGWEWVDPLKEAEASKLAIDMGLSTLADEAASKGKDYDELIGQRVRELVKIKDLEDKNGIKIIRDSSDKSQNNGGTNNGSQTD